MQITQTRSWVALAGLSLLLIATVIWGIIGRIPIETNANTIFQQTEAQPQALLFLPTQEAIQLRPSMFVYLAPQTLSSQLFGTIQTVDLTPLTNEAARNLVGSDMALSQLGFKPGNVAVTVRLIANDTAKEKLIHGTFGAARIVIGEQRPINFMLPVQAAEAS